MRTRKRQKVQKAEMQGRKTPSEMHPGAHQDTLQLAGRNAIVMKRQLTESIHGRKMTDMQRTAMMISKLQEDKKDLAKNAKELADIARGMLERVRELEKENAELKKRLGEEP